MEKKKFDKKQYLLSKKEIENLLIAADDARERAYAPYSLFKVGAAVLAEDGKIYSGSNVENSVYGATVCAERIAIFKAINDGYRSIKAVAIVAKPMAKGRLTLPCGICRQVLSEFGEHITVISSNINNSQIEIMKLEEIFPQPFKMKKNQESDV